MYMGNPDDRQRADRTSACKHRLRSHRVTIGSDKHSWIRNFRNSVNRPIHMRTPVTVRDACRLRCTQICVRKDSGDSRLRRRSTPCDGVGRMDMERCGRCCGSSDRR